MFITAVLIVDIEISKQILSIKQKLVKNPNWREANGWLFASAEELNLGPPNTNPVMI